MAPVNQNNPAGLRLGDFAPSVARSRSTRACVPSCSASTTTWSWALGSRPSSRSASTWPSTSDPRRRPDRWRYLTDSAASSTAPAQVGGRAGAARLHLHLLDADGPHVGGDRADDFLRLRGGDGRVPVDAAHRLHGRQRGAGVLHHGSLLRRAVAVGLHYQPQPVGHGLVPDHGRGGPDHRLDREHLRGLEHAAIRASRCSAF